MLSLVTVEVERRTSQEPTRRWAVLRTREIYPPVINIHGYLFTTVEAHPAPSRTHTRAEKKRERERERIRLSSAGAFLLVCATRTIGKLVSILVSHQLVFHLKIASIFVWQECKDDDDDALWWHEKKQQQF